MSEVSKQKSKLKVGTLNEEHIVNIFIIDDSMSRLWYDIVSSIPTVLYAKSSTIRHFDT